MPVIISNASPLIGLCQVDLLNILKELWMGIVIPHAVYKEVVIEGAGKPGSKMIDQACQDWIKVVAINNRQEAEVLRAVLDEGEAEVITLGQELNSELLLLDNKEPRLFAKGVNLRVIGTIGVIKLAWQRGLVKDPISILHRLLQNGFWIDKDIIERIKAEILEKSASFINDQK